MFDNKLILLDLDGVCCDFIKSAAEKLNKPELIDNWPIGMTKLHDVAGMSSNEMWEILEKYGSDFWRHLEEYSWFKTMFKELSKLGQVSFCTSPNLDPNSAKGKVEWLQDRFGKHFRHYIITSEKFCCAKENHLLIDDMDKNCKEFVEHGGEAILFPQPWNFNHPITDKLEYVLERAKLWAIS